MFSFKRQVGNQAEAVALEHLCKHGLELIEQNYLTKIGHITSPPSKYSLSCSI